jgi:hypothetical protein
MKRSDLEKLGGTNEVARICGVKPSTVCMWFYPKEKNGGGGHIPYKHAKKIFNATKLFTLEYIMGDE